MGDIDADRLHAFVARCLTEPDFLTHAMTALPRADASPVSKISKNASSLLSSDDLRRLSLFKGFITRIKHNSLRPIIPITLKLLAVLEQEIAFFEFHSNAFTKLRASGPLSIDDQLTSISCSLTAFCSGWESNIGILVDDILAHETIVHHIKSSPGVVVKPLPNSICWLGFFKVRRFASDVLAACSNLAEGTFRFETDYAAESRILAYWRPKQSPSVTFFETDEITATILSLIDGKRSVADIVRLLADTVSEEQLDGFLSGARQRGLIELHTKR